MRVNLAVLLAEVEDGNEGGSPTVLIGTEPDVEDTELDPIQRAAKVRWNTEV